MSTSHRRDARPLMALLVVLLVVDALLLAGDLARRYGDVAFAGERWGARRDGGWIELFRAAQLLAASAVLLPAPPPAGGAPAPPSG